jgi:hypothetical protein
MHHFSCSGGIALYSRKSETGHVMLNLCFFHPVGFVGHVVHCGASSVQNSDALFFLLGWNRYGFHKKRAGTRCAFWCVWV